MTRIRNRGFLGAIVDRLFAWRKGLPPERGSFTIQSIRIPLDDQVSVWADLYTPIKFSPLGTILVRSPYGISWPSSITFARIYAARGYLVLLSSCRGTSDGSGVFDPIVNEYADGHATVAWMRQQSWYTGSFATLGGSYLGFNQLALLADPPEDMKAASVMTGVSSFPDFVWGTGTLSSNIVNWADIVTRLGSTGLLSVMSALRSQKKRLQPVFDAVPLWDAINRHFGGKVPEWLPPLLKVPDPDNKRLKAMDQKVALERANIPVLLTTGWDDLILYDVMNQYRVLKSRGVDVSLDVGPWTHLGCQRAANTLQETLRLLDTHLGQQKPKQRAAPVRIYVNGAEEWRDLQTWPPATKPHELFLDASMKLHTTKPLSSATSASFTFNPADPTPSMAHPLLFDNGPGRSESDAPLATRSDVLVFETSPLHQAIEICGQPIIHLQHSTDSPNADVLVLLSEVNAKGRSRSITEKYLRLDPQRDQNVPLELALLDCAHRFQKGCTIRVLVAGGSHPRYIRNLGTGEDSVKGAKMQAVEHTIKLADGMSRLVLPVTIGA